ncbi:MAG: hydrogenase [Acetobacteraceae bacterium]
MPIPIGHLASLPASIFTLIAIASLLLTFVMLGSRWLRHYLYAYGAQSWLIGLLSAGVAFYGGFPELYAIAVITCLFRGLLLPYLLLVIMRRLKVPREAHVILQPSTTLVIAALAVVFALGVSWKITAELNLGGTVAVLALTVMLAMSLLGFLMLGTRHEAMSQVLGLLILENGIFLGSQILVPGMPFFLETVILFDLLIVVACLGVLVNTLIVEAGTTSGLELKRLVG